MIELRSLSFAYPNGLVALSEINLTIPRGQRVAVVGPSGAGKSTLLLHLNGLLPEELNGTSDAAVVVNGLGVAKENLRQVRRAVGLLFQDPDDQLFCPTVKEDVAFGPMHLGLEPAAIEERVERALKAVNCSHLAERSTQQLSFGEKKLVCLAGLLACDAEYLVLDEPFNHLDPRSRRLFREILSSLPAGLVLATHDLALVVDLCERTVVLDRGRISADGPTRKILSDAMLMERSGLEVPIVLQRG